jgi:Ca2+-binding EF-hand superfamily protein
MLSQFDKDGDGKLSNEEVPERMRPLMSGADEDGDGKIDRSELIGAMSRMPGRGRGPGGPDGAGGPGAGGAGGSGGAP